jgi:hypothetical protein
MNIKKINTYGPLSSIGNQLNQRTIRIYMYIFALLLFTYKSIAYKPQLASKRMNENLINL